MPDPAAMLTGRVAEWLPRVRWFAGKGRADGVTIAVHDRLPVAPVSLLLVDVADAGGEHRQRYAVPVDATAADAAATPEFAGWLAAFVIGGGRAETDRGTFVGRPVPTASPAPQAGEPAPWTPSPTESVTVRPLGHDASNTSLLVEPPRGGPGLVIKLLRRCRAGVQPEVEVGEFLALPGPRATWGGTPRLRGWLEYRPREPAEPTVIATIHDAVPDCVSAWDRLGSLVTAGGLHGADRDRILSIVADLGTTTGRMHAALASRPDIAAFAPEPATPRACKAIAAGMTSRLAEVVGLARAEAVRHADPIRRRLVRFADREADFADRLRAVATIATVSNLIRIHGDYHLGQVLLHGRDNLPIVIDFEGEPARPLAERRAKAPACRDVAGMCRSFDYLLRHAARHGGAVWQAGDLRLLETTFRDAYAGVAAGRAWWPAEETVAARLLDVFTLDKAVYELAYEIRNRPDWIEVPLAAVDGA